MRPVWDTFCAEVQKSLQYNNWNDVFPDEISEKVAGFLAVGQDQAPWKLSAVLIIRYLHSRYEKRYNMLLPPQAHAWSVIG